MSTFAASLFDGVDEHVPAIDPPHPLGAERFAHKLIRASAGSGKTHQLTDRYLELIASGADPASMLATTFTRVAAGEIRDRVLMRLAKAADDAENRRTLARHLGLASDSRQAIIDLLAALARRLHRMQIRTLDSFFASIVRAFAIELGLPIDAEVVDEVEAGVLRAEAVRLMLDERRPQEMVNLLRLLTQGSADRAVCRTIDQVVLELHALYEESPKEAWDCVPHAEGELKPSGLVEAIADLERAACGGDKRFADAHRTDCAKARAWDWPEFLRSGLARKVSEGEGTYSRKAIDPALIAAYQPVVRHARATLINRVRNQTLATRDLLALFDRHYRRIKSERRALTFADLTSAMASADRLGKLDEIGFRIDARLRHVLFDEFQDTSVAQWRALEPIVREIICYAPPERTFFCVGDVKQSIYAWRDAAPEVLDELPTLLRGADGASAISEGQLTCSYRSAQPVIDAVNQVFSSISTNAALHNDHDAAALWQSGFAPHTTKKIDLPGYVELRTCRRTLEGQHKDANRFELAADIVAELHRRDPGLKIAVLTRTNEAVARLMFELGPGTGRRGVGIRVSGRGGVPLTDVPAVNAILDLLHMADHPADTVAAFNVASSRLGPSLGLTDVRDVRQRRIVSRTARRALLDDGYGRTIAMWARIAASDCDAREQRRLAQLVDLAGAYEPRATLRTADFIHAVQQTPVADPQAAPVSVMTIHQAKGLEFDVVVLPELESYLTGVGRPKLVFDRTGGAGPIHRICRSAKSHTRNLLPHLAPLFARQRRRTVRESLSLLYVAMTRAIHGLYMIIEPAVENERTLPRRLSGVLRHALAASKPCVPDTPLYTRGDPLWGQVRQIASESLAVDEMRARAVMSPQAGHEGDLWKRGAKVAGASTLSAAARFEAVNLPDPEARDRGIAIHRLFEQIEWLDDFQPSAPELTRLVQRTLPRRNERWAEQLVRRFVEQIEHPEMRRVLSLNGADRGSVRCHREHPFARLVQGKLQSGFIDRLVMRVDGAGRVASASIIDFKVSGAGEAAHADLYRPQMEAYREVVAGMLHIERASIDAALLFFDPPQVVDV